MTTIFKVLVGLMSNPYITGVFIAALVAGGVYLAVDESNPQRQGASGSGEHEINDGAQNPELTAEERLAAYEKRRSENRGSSFRKAMEERFDDGEWRRPKEKTY